MSESSNTPIQQLLTIMAQLRDPKRGCPWDRKQTWQTLLPYTLEETYEVVDAVDLPVIAAGGIADGRQLAAALALGACGVQVGTCLLVSEECPIHENYKAALLNAKDSDTIVTGRIGGSPVRVLKNRMSREYVRQEKAGADKMELEKYTLGSLRRAVFEGDTVSGSLMAGQVAGMLHEVRPVADILADLWQGGRQRIAALNTEC